MVYNNVEKLHNRDLRINNKMRSHNNCPTYDADFIGYENGNEVYLFECKHGNIKQIRLSDYQYTCQANTAKKLNIPYWIVIYYPAEKSEIVPNDNWSVWQYYLIPMNDLAKKYTPEPKQLSDLQFAYLRYKLHGADFSQIGKLNNQHIDVSLPQIVP